jgi:hypothetical protein
MKQRAQGLHLGRASRRFAEASALLAKKEESVLAEFARDLQYEAEGLASRGHLLSRRAPREPEPPLLVPSSTPATTLAREALADLVDSTSLPKRHRVVGLAGGGVEVQADYLPGGKIDRA